MKKKVLFHCVFGGAMGLTISTLITIVISATVGDGNFYPVAPGLIEDCGSELNAVILQTVFAMVYGAAWAASSLIWEVERWSLLRQTVTHLLVCSFSALPIAYLMHWMPRTAGGIALYFAIFFGIYLVIWLVQYGSMKARIRKMNEKVRQDAEK